MAQEMTSRTANARESSGLFVVLWRGEQAE
jgi:hypothetical protein